jgi:hypothetical protein
MSIKCQCSNGHVLHVKDSLAGKSGLCPHCRVRVNVPDPRADVSEDVILGILGNHVQPPRGDTVSDIDVFADTTPSGIYRQIQPKKCCDRCNEEIPLGTHICPHCHTYIASLRDF